jgi:Tfp pilus assembly protein FimT
MDSGGRELVFVLAVMAVLLVFAVAAVIVFVRVWRRERK